ncbi:hypothetical protein SHIRM173S_10957 [Streptomyces hirsutus]
MSVSPAPRETAAITGMPRSEVRSRVHTWRPARPRASRRPLSHGSSKASRSTPGSRRRLYHHRATASRSTSSRNPCTRASSGLLPAALPLESAHSPSRVPPDEVSKYRVAVGSSRWVPAVRDHTGVHSVGAPGSNGAHTWWNGVWEAFQRSRSAYWRSWNSW